MSGKLSRRAVQSRQDYANTLRATNYEPKLDNYMELMNQDENTQSLFMKTYLNNIYGGESTEFDAYKEQ